MELFVRSRRKVSTISDIIDNLQSMFESETIVEGVENNSTAQLGNSGTLELQQKNVVKFNNQVESTLIELKTVEKLRSICERVEEPKIPWPEIALGLSSLLAGAFLSALISGIALEVNLRSVFFYIISPSISAGCGVAFIFLRKQSQASAKRLADHIVEYLPDFATENGKEQSGYNES